MTVKDIRQARVPAHIMRAAMAGPTITPTRATPAVKKAAVDDAALHWQCEFCKHMRGISRACMRLNPRVWVCSACLCDCIGKYNAAHTPTFPPVPVESKRADVKVIPANERGPGIAAKQLPAPRQPYICAIDDYDLLSDAKEGWRR